MKQLSIFFILFFFGNAVTEAQILNRIKRRIENRVEQKLEEKVSDAISDKIDEKIDDALEDDGEKQENNEEASSDARTNAQSAEDMSKSFESMFNAKPKKSEYNFKGYIQMKITSQDEKPIVTEQYFNPNKKQYVIKMNNGNSNTTYMVFADDQIINFSNSNGEKSLFVFPSNLGDRMSKKMSPESDFDRSKLKKTGRTKMILGHLCHEYIMKDDDVDVISWVTTDLNIPNLFEQNDQKNMEGYSLETIITDHEKTTTISVTEIDMNKTFQIRTSDYQ